MCCSVVSYDLQACQKFVYLLSFLLEHDELQVLYFPLRRKAEITDIVFLILKASFVLKREKVCAPVFCRCM